MDHDKKIIRYLDGEMQAEEVHQFEEEIMKDPSLAGLVEEIRNLQDMAKKAIGSEGDPEAGLDEEIRKEIRDMVKEYRENRSPDKEKKANQDHPGEFNNSLQEAAETYFQKPSGKLRRMKINWYAAAAVIVAGALLSVLFLRPFTKLDPAGIYAQYAGIYAKTEQVAELTRSDDDFLFAVEVFESRDYERAIGLFQSLADSIPTRDFSMLYLGHAYMGLNQTLSAISAYEKLIPEAEGALLDDTRWYLSLCYLKKEMLDKAIVLLEEISVSDSPYRAESRQLLRSIR